MKWKKERNQTDRVIDQDKWILSFSRTKSNFLAWLRETLTPGVVVVVPVQLSTNCWLCFFNVEKISLNQQAIP
jgi:hypothetical protein